MCCILENYQTEKGLNVPEVLRPFVGCDFIPFKEELMPGFIKEKKADKKKEGGDKKGKKDKKEKEEKTEDKKEENKEVKEEEKLE